VSESMEIESDSSMVVGPESRAEDNTLDKVWSVVPQVLGNCSVEVEGGQGSRQSKICPEENPV
jgi:hypothetical protein